MIKNKYLPKRHGPKHVCVVVAAVLWVSVAHAQESTNASGGDATGSGGSVAYSIGQAVYTTNTGTTGSVAQGVQQVYEIITVGTRNTETEISLTAYPNPTADELTLRINDYSNERLSYQLYDMQGKLLQSTQVTEQQTQIDMRGLPNATFLLSIVNDADQKIQSFRIVKN